MIFAVAAVLAVTGAAIVKATTSGKRGNKSASKKTPSSPSKTKLAEIKIKKEKIQRKVQYTFKILKLKPDIEVIWCEKTARDDAYIFNLIKYIDEDNGFRDHGILMVCRRRTSRENNSYMSNGTDTYPRRLIVRLVDESTTESRKAILMLLREYMMRPEHNRFSYDYVVDETSDLTPRNEENLEPANEYIQDVDIVNLIVAIYDANENWYSTNQETATAFFGEFPYPRYAMEQLGYPDSDPNHVGEFARGFNAAND